MNGKNLKEIRTNLKLTRKAVVEALLTKGLTITEQTLTNWELDKHNPDLTDAVMLAQVYGVTLEALAG